MKFQEKPPEVKPTFEADKDGYVKLGDISRRFFKGKQSQYLSRYVDGFFGVDDYPKLGEGLRVKGDSDNYHNMKIHKDDIDEFVKRYNAHLSQQKF
jgi:hypothetical protein